MARVRVEFIHTDSSCDEMGRMVKDVAAQYGDFVEFKIYVAGRDVDYLKKFGSISKGTMIINGKIKYDDLNREIIETAIETALEVSPAGCCCG